MERIKHDVVQGSPEWLSLRSGKRNASEAAAALGISPHTPRTEMLRLRSTGAEKEFSEWVQKHVLNRGHEFEIKGRELAEGILGQQLFPMVMSYGSLNASLDGLTMDDSMSFEHKQWNEELAASVRAGVLPDYQQPQVQQGIEVSGADACLFMVSDGTPERCEWMIVVRDENWIKRVYAGWDQFDADLANYKIPTDTGKIAVAEPEAMPALQIEISGRVLSSNLVAWKASAMERIKAINEDLQTDEDFAIADRMKNFLADGEAKLELVKQQAQSQATEIDELFRSIDAIRSEMRAKRLTLERLVSDRKEAIRAGILKEGQDEFLAHTEELNKRIGIKVLPVPSAMPNFTSAMKGKRTVATLREAVNAELTRAKLDSSELASRAQANIASLASEAGDRRFLFPDLASACLKTPEDFANMIAARLAQHNEAEEKRTLEAASATTAAAVPSAEVRATKEAIGTLGLQAVLDAAAPATIAAALSTATPLTGSPILAAQAGDTQAAVIDHQKEIAAFLASREWKRGKEAEARAVLVEFFKWKANPDHAKAA